jgi:hypothetical protein
MRQYGITPDEYDALFEKQHGACAICRSNTDLVIDHNHQTGVVRGLLCASCNKALGFFIDDPDVALRAASYLTKDQVPDADS